MVVANVDCQRREKQRLVWLCLDDGTGRIDRSSKFRCFLEENVLEEQEFESVYILFAIERLKLTLACCKATSLMSALF